MISYSNGIYVASGDNTIGWGLRWGPYGGDNKIIDATLNAQAANIQKMVFAEGIELIPENFDLNNFTGVEEVVFPSTLKEIQKNAFINKNNLTKINLEDTKVKQIGNDAFKGCSFETLTFPDTIQSIGDRAFVDIWKLDTVYLPVNENLKIGTGAFARDWWVSQFKGKSLKVIMDGTFIVGDDNVKATAFCMDSTLNGDPVENRKVNLIYDSTKMQMAPSGLEGVTKTANSHYEIHDIDGDGKLNVFMYTFGADQQYKLFAGIYNVNYTNDNELNNVVEIANGTVGTKQLVNTEYDGVAIGEGQTVKVFLWDNFVNLTPLASAF